MISSENTVRRVATDASDPIAAIRARAVADANRLRALAFVALRDGMPNATLRAAHARAGARAVLLHARRVSAIVVKMDRAWTRGLVRYPAEVPDPPGHAR